MAVKAQPVRKYDVTVIFDENYAYSAEGVSYEAFALNESQSMLTFYGKEKDKPFSIIVPSDTCIIVQEVESHLTAVES